MKTDDKSEAPAALPPSASCRTGCNGGGPSMINNMRCAAEEAASMLSAIGSSHRLLILCALMESEKTVSELCDVIDLRQSTASQHLSRLRLDGLVRADRQGRFVVYSLADSAAKDIISILHRHFCAEKHDNVHCSLTDDE